MGGTRSVKRQQTAAEEVANTLSHGAAFLAALVALPFFVRVGREAGGAGAVVGMTVFAVSMVALYLTSALYHAWPVGPVKRTLRLVDHAAIFLLIAGTYTPFTLGVLRGAWGWTIFAIVWSLCLAGILVEVLGNLRYSRVSLVLYIASGWTILVALRPLWLATPVPGVVLLFAGGAAYTGGVVFYKLDRPYFHVLWHVCVVAGTACHAAAVYWYAM